MVGGTKTSTHDVTKKDLRSAFSKSKTLEIASAATRTLNGHLKIRILVIVKRCCSISLALGTSQINEQARRYGVVAVTGLVLVEALIMS